MNNRTTKNQLFYKTLFKDPLQILPQTQGQNDNAPLILQTKIIIKKTENSLPLHLQTRPFENVLSERIVKQLPLLNFNAQQLSTRNSQPITTTDELTNRSSPKNNGNQKEKMEPKRIGRRIELNTKWILNNQTNFQQLHMGSPKLPLSIVPLRAARHTISQDHVTKSQELKGANKESTEGGRKVVVSSIGNLGERPLSSYYDSQLPGKKNDLELNNDIVQSTQDSEKSTTSIENKLAERSPRSESDEDNMGQSNDIRGSLQDFETKGSQQESEEDSKFPNNNVKKSKTFKRKNFIRRERKAQTTKINATTLKEVALNAKIPKVKQRNTTKNFAIKTYTNQISKPIKGVDIVVPQEKKKKSADDSLFFLNSSSSSDESTFIEYVKSVKLEDGLRTMQ